MATADPEIQAMAEVLDKLAGLESEEARIRVIDYVAKRHGIGLTARRETTFVGTSIAADDIEAEGQFKHFSDLLDATHSPSSDADRALVGGYWFQVVRGQETFTGFEVNNELKNAGHGIRNITDALTTLQRRTPAQVRQTMKSGRTRQARKTYKLTVAGTRAVEAMMGRGAADGGESEEE